MTSISVLIPVFKSGDKLISCINSVLSQTVQPDEILIFDDCPEDSMKNIVSKFDSPLIQYRVNLKNIGRTKNYRKLINSSKSEYFLLLDGDDELTDLNFIELAKNKLSDFKYIIYSGGVILNRENEVLERIIVNQDTVFNGYDYFLKWVSAAQTLPHSSTIFKKSNIQSNNLYSLNVINTDIVSQRIMLLFGDIYISNRIFSKWNYTGNNSSYISKSTDLINNYETINYPFLRAIKIKGFSSSLLFWYIKSTVYYLSSTISIIYKNNFLKIPAFIFGFLFKYFKIPILLIFLWFIF